MGKIKEIIRKEKVINFDIGKLGTGNDKKSEIEKLQIQKQITQTVKGAQFENIRRHYLEKNITYSYTLFFNKFIM